MPPTSFYFGAYEAGLFEGDAPREPGLHRYTPCEGPGHDEFQSFRAMGGEPRCHYDSDGVRVSFSVRNCPRYGVLDLTDLEIHPLPIEPP